MTRTMLPPSRSRLLSRHRSRHVIAAAALAAALSLAACGSSGGGTKGASSAASGAGSGSGGGSTVDVKNFAFGPKTLTVKVGQTVTWDFEDSAKHTVQADDKSFMSDALSGGKKYSYTFHQAGTYSYICSIHQYMTGTIVVK